MTRTLVAILVGFALAALAASALEPRPRAGVLTGYLLGASVASAGTSWQRRALRRRPERVTAVMALSFLAKLAVILVSALAVRYVEPLARVADWKSFLVAFAGGAYLCLMAGVLDNARLLRGEPSR